MSRGNIGCIDASNACMLSVWVHGPVVLHKLCSKFNNMRREAKHSKCIQVTMLLLEQTWWHCWLVYEPCYVLGYSFKGVARLVPALTALLL